MKKFSLSLAVASLALLSACGALKNMDDMKTTTEKMNQTTSDMSKTTTDMSKTTSGMSSTTEKMWKGVSFTYADMRIGNTRDARQNALEALSKTNNQAAQLGYASEYFASMEYQFWKPELESSQDRDDMKAVAVKDFFRKIKEYIGDRNADILHISATNTASTQLLALAGTLHYVNLAQTNALKSAKDQPVVTMLSMIEDGLKAKAALEAGTASELTLPEYQAEVLRNEQDAIYLLRMRQNFLKMMVISLASSEASGDGTARIPEFMQTMGALQAAAAAAQAGTPVTSAPPKWKPNFDNRNAAQINYMSTILQYAASDLAFLKAQGIDAKTEAGTKAVLSLIDVSALSRTEPAQAKAIDRFASAVAAVLAQ